MPEIEKRSANGNNTNTNNNPSYPNLPSTSPAQRIPKGAWITLAILGSSILITLYGETMLLPAIPDIIRDFDISYSTSSWILTAYLVAGAVMTPIAGKLSDMYGRKKMIIIIMIVYIIGLVAGGFSTNYSFLLIARIIQGIGISMFPIAFGIVRDQFPREKLAIGVGLFSSMFAAGSVVGLAVGGAIIETLGWRATFFSIIPFAIVLWFIISRYIRDREEENLTHREEEGQITTQGRREEEYCIGCGKIITASKVNTLDIKGAITLAVTISTLLLAITYLGSAGTSNIIGSIEFFGFLAAAIVSLILFIIIEKKTTSPLIDLKLLSHKIILPANIIIMIFGITMLMVYQTIPILVQSPQPLGFGGDAITTANVQLPFMAVFLIFAPSSGFIISKLGSLKPTIVGTIISTIGFFSLFMFHSTELLIASNLAIIATGLSLMQVGAFNIVMESTPRQSSGVSIGMTVVLNIVGSSIGPAIAAVFLQMNQASINEVSGSFPSAASYNLIFLTAAIISLVSIILVIIIRKRMLLESGVAGIRSNHR
jgi:MFS family permease